MAPVGVILFGPAEGGQFTVLSHNAMNGVGGAEESALLGQRRSEKGSITRLD